MAPWIRSGDLVVTAELPLPLLGGRGAIVLRSERRGSSPGWLLHRVIERGDGWRRTSGDASASADPGVVVDRDVHGVVIVVLPVATLTQGLEVLATRAFAAFTAQRSVAVELSSSESASIAQVSSVASGTDASGRLLPSGITTVTYQLGWSGSARHVLRIDAAAFAQYVNSATGSIHALARSLRIATRCRDATSTSGEWWAASDLVTAEWSASVEATGRLSEASPGDYAGGLRCEVSVTLIGALSAQGATVSLPLTWGPQ